jgi:hypothetical protein
MPVLLLQAPAPDETLPLTRIGGRPLAPPGFAWPACGECAAPLSFLAQARLRDASPSFADRLLLFFKCDGTLCAGGAPGSNANHTPCFALDGLAPLDPPDAPEGVSPAVRLLEGLRQVPYESTYEEARVLVTDPDFVYGHLGDPAESVSEFVPTCAKCDVPMQFVLQLEQGWDEETAMNFNGVTAFSYICPQCWEVGSSFVDDFY